MIPDKKDPKFLKILKLHRNTVLPSEKDKQILNALRNIKKQNTRKSVYFSVKYALPVTLVLAVTVGTLYFSSISKNTANTRSFESEDKFSELNIQAKPANKNIPAQKQSPENILKVKYAWALKTFNPKKSKIFKAGTTLNFDDKVKAEILKTAKITKIAPYKYKQHSGTVFYKVAHIGISAVPVKIEAGGGTVKIVGTEFILKAEKTFSELILKKGKVIITENGKKHILTAGNSLKWTVKHIITEKEILAVLKKYKKQGKHVKALKYINSILPKVSPELKESLILDRIGIKAALLNKWDDACNDLKNYLARYKNGKFRKSALFLWNRYRCTK